MCCTLLFNPLFLFAATVLEVGEKKEKEDAWGSVLDYFIFSELFLLRSTIVYIFIGKYRE